MFLPLLHGVQVIVLPRWLKPVSTLINQMCTASVSSSLRCWLEKLLSNHRDVMIWLISQDGSSLLLGRNGQLRFLMLSWWGTKTLKKKWCRCCKLPCPVWQRCQTWDLPWMKLLEWLKKSGNQTQRTGHLLKRTNPRTQMCRLHDWLKPLLVYACQVSSYNCEEFIKCRIEHFIFVHA